MNKINIANQILLLTKNFTIPVCFFDSNEYCIVTINKYLSDNKYLCEVENSWLFERVFYSKNILANAYIKDDFWLVNLSVSKFNNLELIIIEKNKNYLIRSYPVFMT